MKFYIGLIAIVIIGFGYSSAFAVSNYYNLITSFDKMPDYLTTAATAWESVNDFNQTVTTIKTELDDSVVLSETKFARIISTLAYNETSLNIFETLQHVEDAFIAVDNPLSKMNGNKLLLGANAIGNISKYDSEYNAEFEVQSIGGNMQITGYVDKNFAIGGQFTATVSDKSGGDIDVRADTSSFTGFVKYISNSGVFMNLGATYGITDWDTDKEIVGAIYDSEYSSQFMAARMNTGIVWMDKNFFVLPEIGFTYTYMNMDSYTDFALQEFAGWTNQRMSGGMEVAFGLNMPISSTWLMTPKMVMGADYDFWTDGADNVSVELISDDIYYVPIEDLHKTAIKTGMGIWFYSDNMQFGLDYRVFVRGDYTNQTGFLSAKFAF